MIAAYEGGVLKACYDYDVYGQQKSKTESGSTVHLIHDPFGRLIAEHDGATGAALREYLYLGLMPIAMIDHSGASPEIYYIHTDQVMQPQKMTDATGTVVWDRVATPFGVEVMASGSLTQGLRFPGQLEDSETSLFQNWNRDYDPLLGRYVQSDPIGLMGAINTYAYVGGNPLTRVDPTGLENPFGGGITPSGPAPRGRPIDDLYREQREWRDWGHENVRGPENSEMRHCTVSCIVSQNQGTPIARTAGAGNEMMGFLRWDTLMLTRRRPWGDTPWAFQMKDFSSNEKGFSCKPGCSASNNEMTVDQCIACCNMEDE